jgi:hypothetical protein
MDAAVVGAISAVLASGATLLGGVIVQSIRSAAETDTARVSTQAKLEEHWTDTTLELVDSLRKELTTVREEVQQLRPLVGKLAHFEESLDHIHALLASLRSANDIEISAAVRRAQAFLNRMRGTDAKGEVRQVAQTQISAARIVNDAISGKPER